MQPSDGQVIGASSASSYSAAAAAEQPARTADGDPRHDQNTVLVNGVSQLSF
jgi:hypothetical protein